MACLGGNRSTCQFSHLRRHRTVQFAYASQSDIFTSNAYAASLSNKPSNNVSIKHKTPSILVVIFTQYFSCFAEKDLHFVWQKKLHIYEVN